MSSTKKPDDTAQLVAQARSFSQQFGALLQVAGMLDQVGSLRDELETLAVKRDRALHELDVLFGEKDAELRVLTEQIETRIRAEHAEAERVLAQEADMRKSVENLSTEIQDRRRVLTGLEAQIFRAEAAYGDLNSRLSALRGSIPVGA